jgi:hypothetical protein
MPKRLVLPIILVLVMVSCIASPYAQSRYESHAGCSESLEGLRPGDDCYLHETYHPIYQTLNKGSDAYWDSCCKGNECRVTEDIENAPAELKSKKVDYIVVINGRACPVTASKEVRLSPKQQLQAKTNLLYQSFLQYSHVCANFGTKSTKYSGRKAGSRIPYDPEEAKDCPVVHCVFVGPRM